MTLWVREYLLGVSKCHTPKNVPLNLVPISELCLYICLCSRLITLQVRECEGAVVVIQVHLVWANKEAFQDHGKQIQKYTRDLKVTNMIW